ncbi:MAG: hypothetical protein A4E57_00253 [Syntrophorhabdaceae bacterium PtaU1.Bin034]|jgi:hypothetical protein|nr:MAG: hypothetical protein A4E57_00253 [Syntrophorhabdaceae bacterium PtaU1.Bin034]
MGTTSLAIIHYPVLDKQGDIVSTSLNNLELHDVARSCMTFGVELCYIVTPLDKQRAIAEQLVDHWKSGYGRSYNPDRAAALNKISIKRAVADVMSEFQGLEPVLIGTSSKRRDTSIGYGELKNWIQADPRPFLLLFGTGWGLPAEIVENCERVLLPVKGAGEYNHLSLRVVIGIILDRLFGE